MPCQYTEKRVVIFLNGEVASKDRVRFELQGDDCIICADGGFNIIEDMGITPDLVLGDFDSVLSSNLNIIEKRKIKVLRYPADKDKTDFELALEAAIERKATKVLVIAPFGGRIDHVLGNVFLTAFGFSKNLSISLFDGKTRACILHGGQKIQLKQIHGELLSLIPLSKIVTGVELGGVNWPLENRQLKIGSTLTISNKITSATAGVSIDDGVLFIVQSLQDDGL